MYCIKSSSEIIISIVSTPIPKSNRKIIIIECKGRANESFPLRYKLFKKVVNKEQPHVIIYKPQNHKECDKTVELILEKQNS